MELVLIISIVIVCGVVISIYLVKRNQNTAVMLMREQVDSLREQVRSNLDTNSQLLLQQLGQTTQFVSENINALTNRINDRLKDNTVMLQHASKNFGERLDNASKVVGEVQNRLGRIEESSLRIYEIGKDISKLQEILRAPKLRGNLGELFLGDLLSQILPPEHFRLQYSFKNGEKVDAVIILAQGFVPIDSKFPLENFRKFLDVENEHKPGFRKQFINDVKKHIDAISSKYIKQDEGTFDFALMYVPAENIYYETIIKDDASADDHSLLQYSIKKRVIPVSPNSFYSYLQVILLGLKGLHIEEGVKEVLSAIERLKGDFSKFNDDFSVLGKHLHNARNMYESADRKLDALQTRLENTIETKKIKDKDDTEKESNNN